MGCDRGVLALSKQEAGELEVVVVDLRLFGKSDRVRFGIGALAQTDRDAELVEVTNVVLRAKEVRLENGSYTTASRVESFDD